MNRDRGHRVDGLRGVCCACSECKMEFPVQSGGSMQAKLMSPRTSRRTMWRMGMSCTVVALVFWMSAALVQAQQSPSQQQRDQISQQIQSLGVCRE